VLRHFIRLGAEDSVEIVQTAGAVGGHRPPGTRLDAGEFLQFMGLLKLAEHAYESIRQKENEGAGRAARQPEQAMSAYEVSGNAQA